MKQILSAIIFLGCITANVSAQYSVALQVGMSPSVDPGTSHMIVNRGDLIQEGLFNVNQVKYSPQIGVSVRRDLNQFWFKTELKYGQNTTRYSLMSTRQYTESLPTPSYYEVRKGVVELPLTAGVKLGMFQVFSGFFMDANIQLKNDLSQVEGYTSKAPVLQPGWLSGVGINLGNVQFDVRYQQEFNNYGKGTYLNGEELLMHNAPGHMVMTLGYLL